MDKTLTSRYGVRDLSSNKKATLQLTRPEEAQTTFLQALQRNACGVSADDQQCALPVGILAS